MTKKICLITGSRAEYDRLYWFIKELEAAPGLDLQLIVTGAHLSEKFGRTVETIEKDGFAISGQVEMTADSDSCLDITRSVGVGTMRFAEVLSELKPDLVVIYGDRFELLSIASACVCLHIPIAHIAGGQITEGAIDDQIRHMLTKASHLHFVANELFAGRLVQMGEESWRVCVSGSPAIDSISRLKLLDKETLSKDLSFEISDKTALVTFHPVTLDLKSLRDQIDGLLDALLRANREFGLNYVMTYPNADAGSHSIIDTLERFSRENPSFVRLVKNLGQMRYLSLLAQVLMMIGNSSSGVVESPSFGLPAVNIGDRQKGRLFAENVIQTQYSSQSIFEGIKKGLTRNRVKCANPYGDGKASQRIVEFIEQMLTKKSVKTILQKKFVDLKEKRTV